MIKKCLFPAAGYGSRFLPATRTVPKEMLPILNKPLIQYAVEEARASGILDMAMVIGRGKTAIADYFDQIPELTELLADGSKAELVGEIERLIEECRFTFTRQKEKKGLGHAILTGQPLIGNEPFAVILADDLCLGTEEEGGVVTQMTRLYDKYGCSIVAIEEVPVEEVEKYGVIAGDPVEDGVYRVRDMVEKPQPDQAPSNLAIIGRYILTPDIFEILESTQPGKGGEIQITDALLEQARQGKVLAYRFKGTRFDCGSVEGSVAAIQHLWNKQH